jgi:hypothetical protein
LRSKVCSWEARIHAADLRAGSRHSVSPHVKLFVPQQDQLHPSQKQVRTFAVKLDGEGWLGVSADVGRCQGHAHPTPELAKLCALHRARPAGADGNVVLMPVLPSRAARQRAVGDSQGG